jgi:histidinol-phosphate/aromatic aminotransferase/cobyric acid decarboxylase-like protein
MENLLITKTRKMEKRFHFKYMDDIRFQEILKHNKELDKSIQLLKQDNKKLSDALNKYALPALREYQNFSTNSLAKIAQGALERILELLKTR